jgi:hypothetical protein
MTSTHNTIEFVAYTIGANDRLSSDETQALHNEYAIGDDEHRTAMRYTWFVNYIMGKTNHDAATVESILSGKLSKAGIDEDFGDGVYERCSKQFKYHVARDSVTGKAKAVTRDHAPKTVKRATATETALLNVLLTGMTKARALELLGAK